MQKKLIWNTERIRFFLFFLRIRGKNWLGCSSVLIPMLRNHRSSRDRQRFLVNAIDWELSFSLDSLLLVQLVAAAAACLFVSVWVSSLVLLLLLQGTERRSSDLNSSFSLQILLPAVRFQVFWRVNTKLWQCRSLRVGGWGEHSRGLEDGRSSKKRTAHWWWSPLWEQRDEKKQNNCWTCCYIMITWIGVNSDTVNWMCKLTLVLVILSRFCSNHSSTGLDFADSKNQIGSDHIWRWGFYWCLCVH